MNAPATDYPERVTLERRYVASPHGPYVVYVSAIAADGANDDEPVSAYIPGLNHCQGIPRRHLYHSPSAALRKSRELLINDAVQRYCWMGAML